MDFDETYIAHDMTAANRADLAALEAYILDVASHGILFAWISGSSYTLLCERLRKVEGAFVAGAIASSLGAELRTRASGTLAIDCKWLARVHDSGFSSESVAGLLTTLRASGIALKPQTDASEFRASFYYESSGRPREDQLVCDRIVRAAGQWRMRAVVAPCNPAAGDPEGAYDVDVVPLCAGKENVVRYLAERFEIPLESSFAFGDSIGDLEMLRAVGHGFLVQNATAAARRHPYITRRAYAGGILDTLLNELG